MILFVGIVLRTHIWLHSAGLWADEGCVLYNILNRNFLELFTPLDYIQCTPPLFLILEKSVINIFSLNKLAMRFLPYLASMLSVIAFAILSVKVFKNKMSILFSNFLFAFHQDLLFYTQAFKQYSTDVLFSCLIFLIAVEIKNKKLSLINWLFLAVFAIIASLLSYPAIFLILILTAIYLIKVFRCNDFEKPFLAFLIPVSVFYAVYFFLNCLPAITSQGLQLYWHTQEAFYPTNIFQLHQLLGFFLGHECCLILVSLLAFIGFVYFFFKEKFYFFFFLSIFGLAIILAVLNLYPLSPSRVSAFLIPFAIILISSFWNWFGKNKLFSGLVLVFYLFCMQYGLLFENVKSVFSQDIVFKQSNADNFVKSLYSVEVKPTDYIFVDFGSQVIFDQYDYEKKFNKSKKIYIKPNWNFAETMEDRKIGDEIFFFISDDYIADNQYENYQKWIDEHCKVLLSKTSKDGTFIKCRKIK